MRKEIIGNATLFCGDCMEGMQEMGDKAFDLAIVDPPYGLGDKLLIGGARGGMGSLRESFKGLASKSWDVVPEECYFHELTRTTKNQIIWGGNYFLDYLGKTQCFCVWDKMNGTNPMADAELAWTSFTGSVRMFRMHHFSAGYDAKIHPTQKPVPLYKWLLANYAKPGQTILDTHLGSGSSVIACLDRGHSVTAYEIDEEYFDAACLRIEQSLQQLKLAL